MLCDKCHTNEAKVVVRHSISGKVSQFHFCERCANEQGLVGGRMILKIPMPANFGITLPSGPQFREQPLRSSTLEREFEEMIVAPMHKREQTGGTLLERRVEALKEEKKKAVKNEDYKTAAELRDRVRELEKKISE